MGIDVTVLRVFTDPDGNFGNPLGVVDAAQVEPSDRQDLAAQLGYSETIFVDLPALGATTAATTAFATIYTPRTEIPFAGHPTVGASWWLRAQDMPINTLQAPAGIVQVSHDGGLTTISARAEWAPVFAIHDIDSVDALLSADPADFPDDVAHYLWTWTDRSAGRCGRACSPPISVCVKTKRPGRRRCGSPTTSAATSPSPRARDR